ncbi:MAG: hypothetical protein JWQ97_1167 [Phenylobacterium sp.]|nr:hypothetical protein [Phenylobacterium sp.]
MMISAATLAAAATLASATAAAEPGRSADDGLTLQQLEAMSPQEVANRALAQIAGRVSKAGPDVLLFAPRADLNKAWLVTRAHATWEPDVCESQLIELWFEGAPGRSGIERPPSAPGASAAPDPKAAPSFDPPRRAYRLAVTNRYAATSTFGRRAPDSPSASAQDGCATEHLVTWIVTEDERLAARVFGALKKLQNDPNPSIASCAYDGHPCGRPIEQLRTALGSIEKAQDDTAGLVLSGGSRGPTWRLRIDDTADRLRVKEFELGTPPPQ